jgi:hypothetical protein
MYIKLNTTRCLDDFTLTFEDIPDLINFHDVFIPNSICLTLIIRIFKNAF